MGSRYPLRTFVEGYLASHEQIPRKIEKLLDGLLILIKFS